MKLDSTEYDEYERSYDNRGRTILSCVIGLAVLIIVLGIFFYVKNKVHMSTETVVERYLETYASGMREEELSQLTKTLSNQIDTSLKDLDSRELSQENLMQLMNEVKKELSLNSYQIPESELNELTAKILKQVLEIKEKEDRQKAEEYIAMIDELSKRISDLENLDILGEDDVINLIENNTLTSEEIIQLFENEYSSNVLINKLAEKMNITTADLYKLIAENRDYTNEIYNKLSALVGVNSKDIRTMFESTQNINSSIELLSQKTNVSINEIYQKITESSVLSDEEIKRLAQVMKKNDDDLMMIISETQSNLDTAQYELSNIITSNKNLTDEELASLSDRLGIDVAELRELINALSANLQDNYEELKNTTATRDALIQAQSSIQASLEAEESNRKAAVEQAIKDLEAAITVSGEYDAASLKKARDELQSALATGLNTADSNLQNAVNNANKALEDSINTVDGKIMVLNNAITAINKSIADTNKNVENNSDRITSLDSKLQDNYEELKSTSATKEALLQAQSSIQASLDAEESNRKAAVEQAIKDLNVAISTSEESDAQKLSEAKTALEESLKTGLGNAENELKNAKDLLSTNIANAEAKITVLNNTITSIQSSISSLTSTIQTNKADSDKRAEDLDSSKAEIYYSNTGGVPTLTIDNVIKD